MKKIVFRIARSLSLIALFTLITACTQEFQKRFGSALQNRTGTNGVLECNADDKLVKRFLKIDKLSSAVSTNNANDRPCRFGYGVLDANFN